MARPVNRDRVRKRRRLILLLASIPFVLFAILFAGKLISLSVITQSAISLYSSGSYKASEAQSSNLLPQNFIESWLPYFNRGDAKAGDKDYTSAVDDFEKALQLAPDDKKCEVAVNLAHTWETLGDSYEAGGYHAGAIQLYQAAQDVLASMDGKCDPPDPAANQMQQEKSDIDDKKAQAEANKQQQDGQNSGGTTPDDKLGQLGDKQQQSDQDKANGDARNGDDPGDGSGGGTDKPW